MDDWNNDTCVGKYLKSIYKRRIAKNHDFPYELDDINNFTRSYGGQFHFDVIGLENREIIGMSGFAGQNIIIDTKNSKIIVVNSKYKNYNWEEIVYERIKNI